VALTKGHQLRNSPIKKMRAERFSTFLQKIVGPACSNLGIIKAMALPTAKRKKGNTRSVGVNPCQGACSNGA